MTLFPSIQAIVPLLRWVNRNVTEECDVRLQVYPDGQWAIRHGLSDYDQDHRGYWGASSVPGGNRRFSAPDVARELLDQARNQRAEEQPEPEYLDPADVTGVRDTLVPTSGFTRTGYGSRLATSKMLRLASTRQWHRVYCMCWSNAGTAYVLTCGKRLFLGSYQP